MFNALVNRYVRHGLSLVVGVGLARHWYDPATGSAFVDAATQLLGAGASFIGVTYLSKVSDKLLGLANKAKGYF